MPNKLSGRKCALEMPPRHTHTLLAELLTCNCIFILFDFIVYHISIPANSSYSYSLCRSARRKYQPYRIRHSSCTSLLGTNHIALRCHRRLTRSYTASPRVDSHPSESDAARQFLDALQRSRLEAERIGEQQHQSAAARHPSSDFISTKSKRNSLRDALEELIVDFLRELTPGSSTSGSSIRYRRSARQTDEYEQDGQADEIREEDDETGEQDVNDMRRIEIGSRNITVLPTQRVREPQRIGRPSECAELRRRVTKLDQYELDKALMKDGESRELNIRRVLNHRYARGVA